MLKQIILASKSKVRKKILDENYISCIVEPSNIDEDSVKESLLKQKASPEIILFLTRFLESFWAPKVTPK